MAEAAVSCRRIQKFLLNPESLIQNPSPYNRNPLEAQMSTENIDIPTTIKIINASAKYGDNLCLNNINLELTSGKLTVVIGPIGSGKTCLLNMILGELKPISGKVINTSKTSYASQQPWLFEGSFF